MRITDKEIKFFHGKCLDNNGLTTVCPSSSTGFDLSGFEDAIVIVDLGNAAGTCDVVVKTSTATNGTYAAVTGATMTLTSSDDDNVFYGRLNLTKANQYVRVEVTSSAAACLVSVVVLGMNPRIRPVTQVVTTSTKVFDVTV